MTKCVSNSHDKTHLYPCKFYFDVLLNGTKPNCEGNVKKNKGDLFKLFMSLSSTL